MLENAAGGFSTELHCGMLENAARGGFYTELHCGYTPKAVVIDNHLLRQPLISFYVPD